MFSLFLCLTHSSYFEERVSASQKVTRSLSNVDIVFVNTYNATSANWTFELTPPPAKQLELLPGRAYLFRGQSLTIQAHASSILQFWELPKGLCTYNSFLLDPDFSLSFQAEKFANFCLFTPLDWTDCGFQYATERFSVDDGQYVVFTKDQPGPVTVREKALFNNPGPLVFAGRDESLMSGMFLFEINAAQFGSCSMQRVIDVAGGDEWNDKWYDVQPTCTTISDPAFSLEFAVPSIFLIGIGSLFLFTKLKWITWRKLFGFDKEYVEDPVEAAAEDLRGTQEREEPLLVIDEAL